MSIEANTPTVFDIEAFCRNPEIRDAAPVKIALLRGPIYSDDTAWAALLQYQQEIERFLAEVGLRLTLDRTDGYAYADQAPEGTAGSDWPKVLYRDRFSFDVTCVMVVLREWLISQETKTRENRAPLQLEELLAQLRPFSRKTSANVEREEKRWREAINKVVSMGFLKRWRGEEAFIVRPIIRSRFSLETLKELKATLEKHAASGNQSEETP